MSHEFGPNASLPTALSNREHEMLVFVARGYNEREIADEVSLSPKTVKNYKSNLYEKLGVSNRLHAVLTALKHGELERHEVENELVIVRFPLLKKADPALVGVLNAMREDLGAHSSSAEVGKKLKLAASTIKGYQTAICSFLETRIVPSVVNHQIAQPAN